jgi:hypothetical protein
LIHFHEVKVIISSTSVPLLIIGIAVPCDVNPAVNARLATA